jgi:putative transposase
MPGPRKRLRRRESSGEGRYLTCSCYRRLALLGNDAIKSAFVARLADVRREVPFQLLAWVLMPEHFHLLVIPHLPEYPVDRLLYALKAPLAQRILRRWRELEAPILPRITDPRGRPHFWQVGGGYDRNVVEEVEEKIGYIHANPVRRGLVATAEDWPWSSARWYAGRREGEVAIDPVG